jgi:hypothetical protein
MKANTNIINRIIARVRSAIAGIVNFYVTGFKEMTLGRTLWAMIILKLIILFFVFKLLFFPDILRRDYHDDASRAQAVRTNLINR